MDLASFDSRELLSENYKKIREDMRHRNDEMMIINRHSKQLIGRVGERLAREELEKQGYGLQSFKKCDSGLCYWCGFPTNPSKKFRNVEVLSEYPKRCPRGKNG